MRTQARLRRIVLATILLLSTALVWAAQGLSARTLERTPEQERVAMIIALKAKLPGSEPADWVVGGVAWEPNVRSTPLTADNATNSADILAIGKKRWEQKFRDGKTLAHCFPNGGKRVAATYTQVDPKTKAVITFEDAINRCLRLHGEPTISTDNPEVWSQAMGPLAAWGRSLSEGQKLNVRVSGAAALGRFEAGRHLFHTRLGEQDAACASCHVLKAGTLIGDAGIAPAVGMAVAWPKLLPGGKTRLLSNQFQRCMTRVGAVPFDLQAEEFDNLEYYLAFLSNGLPLRPLTTSER